ncbi:hypothetical protein VSA01S_09300 [Vibrio sagamiensis NBRC 104589]|uniref:Uncharacterized protein n=1 Tax=Vibrio sagamiensis NBRC 104589 TaxID=1219064 RepID=A0A511QBZ6_9VIBR|nr:hypothetical protein VSA01S_09300 [Vibrio sagamiensis NBRC 104589]
MGTNPKLAKRNPNVNAIGDEIKGNKQNNNASQNKACLAFKKGNSFKR